MPVRTMPGPPPREPDSFTIAVLPDTQIYTRFWPQHFVAQTRWIAANARRRNIAFALHLGDITDGNDPRQWTIARAAMAEIDGLVPYAITVGNHDCGTDGSSDSRSSRFNEYFSVADCRRQAGFGGTMEPGRLENSYHRFRAGGQNHLVLALEWAPRDAVLEWADGVLASHPQHRAIVITHAYLYVDGTRYHWRQRRRSQHWNPHSYGIARLEGGCNDGEDLWRKVIGRHANVIMTLNGHVLGSGLALLSSRGRHGNIVHQMLVNYQMQPEGGQAYLRLMEFLPDGRRVRICSYSPALDRRKVDPDNCFELELPGGPDFSRDR